VIFFINRDAGLNQSAGLVASKLRMDIQRNKKMVINIKLASMGYDIPNGASVNVYKINKFIDDYEMKIN
jgi:hypothetical protein